MAIAMGLWSQINRKKEETEKVIWMQKIAIKIGISLYLCYTHGSTSAILLCVHY
jgi:hypothetical protein